VFMLTFVRAAWLALVVPGALRSWAYVFSGTTDVSSWVPVQSACVVDSHGREG
jgi:hypothetical protein